MTRAHFTHSYMMNPQHPVTVNLIGAGGTGSQVLTNLARLDTALVALGHPGIHVTVYDPDTIEQPNIGRMKFSPAEVGLNKAECLITKINAFFGLNWEAVPQKYPIKVKEATNDILANIFITCTDNVTSRYELSGFLTAIAPAVGNRMVDYRTPLYWMDYGNTQKSGQVIVGTINEVEQPTSQKFETVASLPCITDFSDYNNLTETDTEPSCSHAEALAKQDLFINSTLAELGSTILWRMLRQGFIDAHGVFVNLETMTTNPLTV